MMLTIAEISKRLQVPESTIRSWRDRYDDFIPSSGKGRKKRFPDEALAVFRMIAEQSADGATATAIAERLSVENRRYIDNSSSNSSTTAMTVQDAAATLQRMADALERLTQTQDENRQLRARLDQLENRLQDIENRQPFWRRKRKNDRTE